MENLFIDIRNETEAIRKAFDNKHLVSIEELLNKIEELQLDIERLQETIEDIEQDIKDNYKPISQQEQIGWSNEW